MTDACLHAVPASAAPDRLFGARICPLDAPALAALWTAAPVPAGCGLRLVVTMNLDHVVRLQSDAAFRAAYDSAWAVTLDGAPVHRVARMKGLEAPRCPGADLFAELMPRWTPDRRPFFVVSRPEAAERLRAALLARGLPPASVGAASPAFGFERDPQASAALARAIRDHRATDIVFGLGAPKSEVWLHRHRHELGDAWAGCFGSGPDFYVGLASRAPRWVQRAGLEWLWRVLSDPARLWRRYFVDSWVFLPAAWRELRSSRRRAAG